MAPCLADTGLDLSIPLIAIGVLMVGVGIALFVVKKGKRKGAAGAAALSLLLFGMLVVGTSSAAPARAATPDNACASTSAPTPAPIQTPTATPTPTPTPTPTCSPTSFALTDDAWRGSALHGNPVYAAVVQNAELIDLLNTDLPDADPTAGGHVTVTVTATGDADFAGNVTFTWDSLSGELSIPADQLETLAGTNNSWPFDPPTTLVLTFTLANGPACSVDVTVTGPAFVPAG